MDYLQAVHEDAYHVLLRHFIGAQITNKLEWPHRLQIISDHEELVYSGLIIISLGISVL